MGNDPRDILESLRIPIWSMPQANLPPMVMGNVPRSPQWPHTRDAYLKIPENAFCKGCGAVKLLNVHHKKPYHLFKDLELDPKNFITLCESPTHNCHFIAGHCLDWSAYNPRVEELAKLIHDCIKGRLGA